MGRRICPAWSVCHRRTVSRTIGHRIRPCERGVIRSAYVTAASNDSRLCRRGPNDPHNCCQNRERQDRREADDDLKFPFHNFISFPIFSLVESFLSPTACTVRGEPDGRYGALPYQYFIAISTSPPSRSAT